jgi:hypothetical protein
LDKESQEQIRAALKRLQISKGVSIAPQKFAAGASTSGGWMLRIPLERLHVLLRHRLIPQPGGFEGLVPVVEDVIADGFSVSDRETNQNRPSTTAPLACRRPRWKTSAATRSPASMNSPAAISNSPKSVVQSAYI